MTLINLSLHQSGHFRKINDFDHYTPNPTLLLLKFIIIIINTIHVYPVSPYLGLFNILVCHFINKNWQNLKNTKVR